MGLEMSRICPLKTFWWWNDWWARATGFWVSSELNTSSRFYLYLMLFDCQFFQIIYKNISTIQSKYGCKDDAAEKPVLFQTVSTAVWLKQKCDDVCLKDDWYVCRMFLSCYFWPLLHTLTHPVLSMCSSLSSNKMQNFNCCELSFAPKDVSVCLCCQRKIGML